MDDGLPLHEPTLTRPADTLSHPMGEGRGEGWRLTLRFDHTLSK
jgi:hypothetical protein